VAVQSHTPSARELFEMNVAFRVDASLQIGTGHVMRCITLANALRNRRIESCFLCREHAGNLIHFIRSKGYEVHVLPVQNNGIEKHFTAHTAWLGATQAGDAQISSKYLKRLQPKWLIVDHYSLDYFWEQEIREFCQNLMVIDDLADRNHCCDLLLDQNLGRVHTDYINLVPDNCELLIGAKYALLRPEFAGLRCHSLRRRTQTTLRNLLVSMGGVDQPNATCTVLSSLRECLLPHDCQINVVMGATAPWLEQVQDMASQMQCSTKVLVGINDMAKHMADCDLSIGAAGTTSWERCCLGVPSIVLVLADNQKQIARALEQAGAAIVVKSSNGEIGLGKALDKLRPYEKKLAHLSNIASTICDGKGTMHVGEILEQ